MIGYYKMSLIGSSHLSEKGGVCQDFSDAKTLQNGWIVAAIADGLGSAKHSNIGSELAVGEVLRFVEVNAPESWHNESLYSLLRTAFHAALKLIKEKASKDGNVVKDYDTTLTCVIYNGTNVIYGHVGDGGIISLNPYGDFSILTIAQKGEEFNAVTPLRSGPDNWIFGSSNESIVALLMLTDGIYDVACPWLIAKQEQKIYVNYVRPFMDRNILSVKTAADFENAQKEIVEFFTGEHSRKITDDKTLLGIINTDVLPEVKVDDYYAEPDWKKLSTEHQEKLYGSKPSSSTEEAENCTETASTEGTKKYRLKENDELTEVVVETNTQNQIENSAKDITPNDSGSLISRIIKKMIMKVKVLWKLM